MVYYTFDWSILQIPEYAYMKQVDVKTILLKENGIRKATSSPNLSFFPFLEDSAGDSYYRST